MLRGRGRQTPEEVAEAFQARCTGWNRLAMLGSVIWALHHDRTKRIQIPDEAIIMIIFRILASADPYPLESAHGTAHLKQDLLVPSQGAIRVPGIAKTAHNLRDRLGSCAGSVALRKRRL